MPYKVILKTPKKTLVSSHNKKRNAEMFKQKIMRERKKGGFPSLKSVRLIRVKKLTR